METASIRVTVVTARQHFSVSLESAEVWWCAWEMLMHRSKVHMHFMPPTELPLVLSLSLKFHYDPWTHSFANLWVTISQFLRLPSRNQLSAFHLSVLGKKISKRRHPQCPFSKKWRNTFEHFCPIRLYSWLKINIQFPTSEYLLMQREMHYALLIKYDEFNTIQFSIL